MADQPVIIKRVKKGGHAHHGGAWKVAYADFVTAMMAFFLLLWLLNSVTEEQLEGISNYFAPTAVSMNPSGAGGILGGQVLGEGASQSNSGSPSVQLTLPPPTIGAGGSDYTDANEGIDESETLGDIPLRGDPDGEPGEGDMDALGRLGVEAGGEPTEEALAAAQEKAQQEEFERTAQELRQAIQSVPSLEAVKDSLLVDNTPEGLRIQLIDQEGLPMFPSGSARMMDYTRKILGLVATAVKDLPNKVSIAGHTDNIPFPDPTGYGNWELSADRALASRRVLMDSGLAESRVDRVVGKAATEPLLPENPADPTNRRITITLLRDRELFSGGSAADNEGPAGETDREPMPSILTVPGTGQL